VVTVVCDAKAMPIVVNLPLCIYQISSRGFSFMRRLVVVEDTGWAVLCLLTNKTSRIKKSQELEYIYPFFLPTPLFGFPPTVNMMLAS